MMELRRERMSTQGIVECAFYHESKIICINTIFVSLVILSMADFYCCNMLNSGTMLLTLA
jgi:hypothetical protein